MVCALIEVACFGSALFVGTQGKMYLSESTVWNWLLRSRKLTPTAFAGFAVVLGIPAVDLATLTGFDLPPGTLPGRPIPAVVAELVWDMRRLSRQQLRLVRETAGLMADGQ